MATSALSAASTSLDGLPAELAEAVSQFDEAVTKVEQLVGRLHAANWPELCRGLGPLETARLHLMVAYTVNTLFYMYLKANGVSPADHPVHAELERIKGYIKKLKAVSQAEERRGAAEQRQLTLDQQAAARFVSHALAAHGEAAPAEGGGAGGVAGGAEARAVREAAARAEERMAAVEGEQAARELRASLKKARKAAARGELEEGMSSDAMKQVAHEAYALAQELSAADEAALGEASEPAEPSDAPPASPKRRVEASGSGTPGKKKLKKSKK
ncbi:hypothetical protein AB1Y20_002564 [Prymnesium parvum]|uniref:Nuclear nucleic acid-binding protein C1D n=1 Tax=Prymnesium parvum TaxID=97485 RepID=A0AB34JAR9_PRYPA